MYGSCGSKCVHCVNVVTMRPNSIYKLPEKINKQKKNVIVCLKILDMYVTNDIKCGMVRDCLRIKNNTQHDTTMTTSSRLMSHRWCTQSISKIPKRIKCAHHFAYRTPSPLNYFFIQCIHNITSNTNVKFRTKHSNLIVFLPFTQNTQ